MVSTQRIRARSPVRRDGDIAIFLKYDGKFMMGRAARMILRRKGRGGAAFIIMGLSDDE